MNSQQGLSFNFDAVVIGSGLAGLSYCLNLIALNPKISIALVSKAELQESNSRYAQGGIAAAVSIEDSWQIHRQDTLNAGDGLCDPLAVETIISQAPAAINQLHRYQVPFKKNLNGDYFLAHEGGHSHRRIFNSGDKTGFDITQTLLKQVLKSSQIQCFADHIAVNLITRYKADFNPNEVTGVYILDTITQKIHNFSAGIIVLATGGAGKTYRYTTNPMVATGDGVAMAYRAGARVSNMEFYQFHPTLLHHPALNNFLISEAVRGEGGLLRCPDTNRCFMEQYSSKLELATRDVVARAIFNEIEHNHYGFVYLDIRHQSREFLKQRFPTIFATLFSIGIDMSQDMIPVVPAAHYQCGGVLTDLQAQTDIKRLLAIGEVACTGLHGANRLASNALLEALVMAEKAAYLSLKWINNKPARNHQAWNSSAVINPRRASQINAHWLSLRGEMTSYAGIVRTEAGLKDLLVLINKRKNIVEDYYWNHAITRDLIELRNIILNAELIVRAALARRESRGGHFREDYPCKNTISHPSLMHC